MCNDIIPGTTSKMQIVPMKRPIETVKWNSKAYLNCAKWKKGGREEQRK